MLRIAICDKDKKHCAKILDYIAKDTEIDDDYMTECFYHYSDVENCMIKKDFAFDLLFLALDADGQEGIAIAEEIRRRKLNVDIIVLAENTDYLSDAFGLNADNYWVKPITYSRFCYDFSQYLKNKNSLRKEYISVTVNGKEQIISLNSVAYFMSETRKIGIHFLNSDEVVRFYGKLDKLEEKVEKQGFFRCHQSYLVNLREVTGISSDEVTLNQEKLPISRRYQSDIKEVWKQYKERNQISYLRNIPSSGATENITALLNATTDIVSQKFQINAREYGVVLGIYGARQNDSYRLYHGKEVFIGRDASRNEIVVNERTVSRQHCCIRFDLQKQCYYVKDLSANGTFLGNGQRISQEDWEEVGRDTLIYLSNDSCAFMLS